MRTECDDLAALERVTDRDIVDVLKARFLARKPYTMCQRVCISVNPNAWCPLYDADTRRMYMKRAVGHAPAHIYKIAEQAFSHTSAASQTIVITGDSGAGKTEVARLCLDFISEQSTDDSSAGQIERALHAQPVLEYLGNAQTTRNANSSRFGKFLTLHYQGTTQVSARIRTYLLEKSRVVGVAPGEGMFRVFYAILGDAQLRDAYALHAVDESVLGQREAAIASSYRSFQRAALAVGFHREQLDCIVHAIVGILFLRMRDYGNAATVLGLDTGILMRTLTHRRVRVGSDEEYWTECAPDEQRARMKALGMALYERTFRRVVEDTNAYVGVGDVGGSNALHILDIFGFETFATNGLEQLCINYCNERIQQFFVDDVIVMQQLEYANEGIDCGHIEFDTTARVVELCEHTIFPLLDEAQRLKTTSDGFVNSIDARRPAAFSVPLVRSTSAIFSIDHYAGRVTYDTEHFWTATPTSFAPSSSI